MFKSVLKKILIGIWELRFLLRSIPYYLNAGKRMLPDYIIIGAPKSGTTSLFEFLSRHPNVKNARMKEPRFFNRYYNLGLRYYRSYFPLISSKVSTGEATTSYFYHSSTPIRIKHLLPKAKLILLLREPVSRAYSHFMMNRNDDPSASFVEALRAESKGNVVYHYIDSSSYAKQLRRWMEHFDAHQILILKSEELFMQQEKCQHKLLSFLELRQIELGPFKQLNDRKYTPLSNVDQEEAKTYFTEDLIELKESFEISWK
ncbi:MAG: hypothetical protein CMO34_04275 [Verrucomicrobia bacterium]|nr:hypothetical protein [Verrucomicrobiota bacterium]|tara:strand:- start:18 stop:794 length:777 start_codon:yes stop_codon:yes gene_type:complete